MIFIDANVFLAYDNEDDLHHNKATVLWKRLDSGVFGPQITSDYVFNEVVGVTLRKKGKARAIILGQQIQRDIVLVNVDDHILEGAWKLFLSTNLNLSLVDCANIVIMKLANTNITATFDKEFKNIKDIEVIDT